MGPKHVIIEGGSGVRHGESELVRHSLSKRSGKLKGSR